MGPEFHNDILDKGLEQVSNSANWGGGVLKLVVTAGHPVSQASAAALYPTGVRVSDEIAMAGGDFVLADRAGGGREITVAAKTGTFQVNVPAIDTGVADITSTVSALVDSDKAWAVNAHANKTVRITAGTGAGQRRRIASNTATALTPATNFVTAPDDTSQYEILEDLHIALYDGGGTPRLLVVLDIDTDQPVINGNPVNLASFKFGYPDPVSV